jgi:L-cystine uptake protein TcyP (sodium:dicarboxylate symporter family)
MNLFAGLTQHQIVSVLATVVLFTVAAGVALVPLLAFGVRAGLMAPEASKDLPPASDAELWTWFASSMSGFVSVLLMIFLGLLGGSVFAETFLDNTPLLVGSIAFILLGGLLFLVALALAFRTARRRPAPA